MKKLLLSLSLSLISASSYGGAILKNPTNAPHGSSLPATCSAGNIFVNTSATTGQQWYVCESANSWVQQGGSGSVSPNLTPTTIKMGSVQVIHSSGTYDVYSPTNTTDGANGAALSRSFSSWTDKMEIRLGPGTFDMGENYLTLYTSTRCALIGAGRNQTFLKFAGPGYGVQTSSFCYLADFASSGSGAGLGGLTDVTGTSLIIDSVNIYGDQDAIAINYNYDNIDIIDSEFGTTFDGMVFTNTNSTATINIYDSKFISKDGSINASGVNCYGVGIVNSWNTVIEVRDAGTRVGYGNGSGLGTCTFNIYGGVIQTYNGGTDIAMYSGAANVTSNLVYISSKTSGTINQLNQTGTTDTSQVYRTTTTPTYPYGMTVSSDGVTFNVNTAGISGFVGAGKSFGISTDEGSSIGLSETNASIYANQNASITGETSVNISGLTGTYLNANNSPIVLNPNYSGGTGGSVTVKDKLLVNDANSQYEIFLGTLPKNGGFGPQNIEQGVWAKGNGSYQTIITTVPRMTTSGGAPYIPADGASLIYSPASLSYSTYTYLTPTGTQVWGVDSTGFLIPSLANNSVIGTDSSGYLVAGTGGISYSSASVSYLGLSTYTAATGTFQKSTMTATSYQTVLSSVTTTVFNWQDGDAKTITLTASSTYTFTNVPIGTNSKTLNVRVINPSTYKMTWPSTVKWTSGVSGSSPTASAVSIYTFQEFDGTVYGAFISGYPR